MTSRTAISPDLDPEKDLEIPIDISLNSPYPQVRAAVRNTVLRLSLEEMGLKEAKPDLSREVHVIV
ncbi:hypothetical protein ACHAPG_005660 [Botrytis cinerea]